jgi:hypothetical protein
MKKNILKFLPLVAMALMAFSFVACGDDDNNEGTGGSSDKRNYVATIEVSEDLLSLATANLQEYGNSGLGAVTELTKTKYDWTKSITTYPAKVGLSLTIEPKEVELTKEKYDLIILYQVDILDEKGNLKGEGQKYSRNLTGVKAEKVAKALSEIKEGLLKKTTLFNFTSASNFTALSRNYFSPLYNRGLDAWRTNRGTKRGKMSI